MPHLIDFVADREGFSWREAAPDSYSLSSGVWRGILWRHDVAVMGPTQGDTCVLYVTGGDINEADLDEARAISQRSGLLVAMLFHIPNQPLFEMMEDDLIAHTFERYIEEGDPEWPLLLPMTRAVVRAIDMLQETRGFQRFVVTGASKRGWTTWLTACTGDPRVAGIAPMVFDHLDFPKQMAHQVSSWGGYSEQISDYTDRELQREVDTDRGAELVAMVDPIRYIDNVRCPILIINGANDRYWTVDALSNYWDRLPDRKRCLIVPNVGHLLGDKRQMIQTLSAFARAVADGAELPYVRVRFEGDLVLIDAPQANETRLWVSLSSSLDFRDSEWFVAGAGTTLSLHPSGGNVAAMVEARFEGRTGEYSLSTPIRVFTGSS